MLCLSGFELYSRWVPLILFVFFPRKSRFGRQSLVRVRGVRGTRVR